MSILVRVVVTESPAGFRIDMFDGNPDAYESHIKVCRMAHQKFSEYKCETYSGVMVLLSTYSGATVYYH